LQPHYLQPEITSYFQNPTGLTQNDINAFEQQIWSRQNLINQKQKQLIKILIRDSINRQLLLEWFGECIYVNANRSQEWLKYSSNNEHASDGFFLNILFLFLDLSQPFCDNIEHLPKIDLSYSVVNTDKTKSFKGIHFLGFDKDTKFLKFDNQNLDQYAEIDVKNEYNFITECFYATHRLYQISFEILYQKLIKINQELVRIQGRKILKQ
jgi:ubiquitin conjugation factor E4 A